MILKSSFEFINEFFNYFLNQIRKFYLNSSIYNKKISKTNLQSFEYKPSPNLLDCLIKYEKKKNKIEDFYINSIWEDNKISLKDYISSFIKNQKK